MKKFLLALTAVVATLGLYAQTPTTTIDFKTATAFKTDDPENPVTFPYTQTISGVEIAFQNENSYIMTDSWNYADNDGDGHPDETNVLMLKKNTGAITFSVAHECTKIVVKTTLGGSNANGAKVTLYAGETKIEQKTLNSAKGSEYTFDLGENGAANTVYKFVADGTSNVQFETIALYEPSTVPTISFDPKNISFAAPLNATTSTTVKVQTENITGSITATCADANVTITPATFTVEEGEAGIEISYSNSEADEVSAEITFTADGATAKLLLTALTVSHTGTESDPLTVSDVLALNNLYKEKAYVTGVIAARNAANAVDGMVSLAKEDAALVDANIVLTEGEKMIGVALPNGDARTQLNIKDNTENPGKTVVVKGSLENYFGAPGVKNTEYVSGLSGIENVAVEAENGPVEYFNLQGVRVENPTNGLYIRRQGTKATKVIL